MTASNIMTQDKVLAVSLTTDTVPYASGDLVADTQVIDNAAVGPGGTVVLNSATLIDGADQKVALYLVFLNGDTSLGTENLAPSISDANAASSVIGMVPIAVTDYVDLGGVAVATVDGIGLLLQATPTSADLYVGVVNSSGAPTYAADDLTLKLGFLRVEQYP